MKAKPIQILLAYLLTAVLAGSEVAVAQQSSPPSLRIAEATPRNERSQLPIPAGASDAPAGIPTLQQLIEQALENNPEIKAMQRRFDMMRARIPQAKALDEPVLSVGYMGNITPFQVQKGDPSRGRTIAISQDLPYPGKRSLRGKVASTEADSEWWTFEQTRWNVVAEVKDAYFDLYYLSKAIGVVTKTKALLEQFTKIAEVRYTVGKGIQQDVLKAQVEFSKLIEQQTMLEQRKQIAEARLNSLLYRESDSPLAVPEQLKPRDFPYTLAALNEKVEVASDELPTHMQFPASTGYKESVSRL